MIPGEEMLHKFCLDKLNINTIEHFIANEKKKTTIENEYHVYFHCQDFTVQRTIFLDSWYFYFSKLIEIDKYRKTQDRDQESRSCPGLVTRHGHGYRLRTNTLPRS